MTKGQLRSVCLRLLKQQGEDDRRRKSEAIRRKVLRLAAFRRARTVCCYVALPYEVQTRRLIEEMLSIGKRVVIPVSQPRTRRLGLSEVHDLDSELAKGPHGVLEPVTSARRPVPRHRVDLYVVPGLAFDRQGHRLGHGYGYFDRLLGSIPKTIPAVGLAYAFQLVDRVPTHPHDRVVQTVLAA